MDISEEIRRDEAADELDSLRAKNLRLRAALRPFAAVVFNDNGDVTYDYSSLTRGHYFAAYQALQTDSNLDPCRRVGRNTP